MASQEQVQSLVSAAEGLRRVKSDRKSKGIHIAVDAASSPSPWGISPPLALNDLMELRIFCQMGEQGSVNVRQYVVEDITGTGPTPGGLLDGISLSVAGNIKPLMSNEATYRGCGMRRVIPKPASVEYLSSAGKGTGNQVIMALAKQTCGMITFTTPYAGRGYRGRMYLPFPDQASNAAGGHPTAAYLTAAQTYATWLCSTLTVGIAPNQIVLTPVLWHRLLGMATDITGSKTPDKWGTQRRRGDYGRPNESPI